MTPAADPRATRRTIEPRNERNEFLQAHSRSTPWPRAVSPWSGVMNWRRAASSAFPRVVRGRVEDVAVAVDGTDEPRAVWIRLDLLVESWDCMIDGSGGWRIVEVDSDF